MQELFNKKTWQKLLGRTKKTAESVAEAAQSGAAVVGQKAEETLACAKLHRRVHELQEEIDLQMGEVGRLIYATHCGTPSDSDSVQEILEYVDSLYEEMEGHHKQMKIMRGALFCDVCGQENTATNVYCHNCGQPLARK